MAKTLERKCRATFIIPALSSQVVAALRDVSVHPPRVALATLMAALSGPNPKAPGFAGDTYLGRRVHLNAVWVMFALFAFGYLFGFVGPLIAVPLAFAIGVLTRFALKTYYASSLYASTATKPPLKS